MLKIHLGTQGAMAKQKLLSRLPKVFSSMPRTRNRCPILPCWHMSTPINAHLHSPTEIPNQGAIHITMPQRIRHKDPKLAANCDQLNDCATQSATYHEHCRKLNSMLCTRQTASVLNDAKTFWLPATVIHEANHGSYFIQISEGQYRCAHDHICEHHLDTVKPD